MVGDLVSYDVISTTSEVRLYAHPRLGIVCQTTMPPSVVDEIRSCIEQKNPQADIRFIDTVCQPTTPKWRHTVERLKQVFSTPSV